MSGFQSKIVDTIWAWIKPAIEQAWTNQNYQLVFGILLAVLVPVIIAYTAEAWITFFILGFNNAWNELDYWSITIQVLWIATNVIEVYVIYMKYNSISKTFVTFLWILCFLLLINEYKDGPVRIIRNKVHSDIQLGIKIFETGRLMLNAPKEMVFPEMEKIEKNKLLKGFKLKELYNSGHDSDNDSVQNRIIVKYETIVHLGEVNLVLGGSGFGKTTILRYMAKDITTNMYWKYRQIKLVVYIELLYVIGNTEIEFEDLLFGNPLYNTLKPEDKTKLTNWALDNSARVVIIMDGLDQLNTKLTDEVLDNLSVYSKGTSKNFLKGLLNKNIMRKSTIVMSSREYALQEMDVDCIPEHIVRIIGFSSTDVEKMIMNWANEGVLNNLKSNRMVYHLGVNPLILGFMVSINLWENQNAPETQSGIVLSILNRFLTYRKTIRGTTLKSFYNLSKLAFNGIKDNKIVFDSKYIKLHHLTAEDLKDICVGVPEPKFASTSDELQYYLIHQSLQEMLAALHTLMLNPEEFQSFLKTASADDHWQEILIYAFGLLFRSENHKLLLNLVPDLEKIWKGKKLHAKADNFLRLNELEPHRILTKDWMASEINHNHGRVPHQHIKFLYEAEMSDVVKEHAKVFVLGPYFSAFDNYRAGKVVAMTDHLKMLQFWCLQDENVKNFTTGVGNKIPTIEQLHSRSIVIKDLSGIANSANELYIGYVEDTQEKMSLFVANLKINKKFTLVSIGSDHRWLKNDINWSQKLMSHVNGTMLLYYKPKHLNDDARMKISKIAKKYKDCEVKFGRVTNAPSSFATDPFEKFKKIIK